MEKEIEKVDDEIVEEDLSTLDDATDWKEKAKEIEQKRREDGIKNRERTKALRAQLDESRKPKIPEKSDKSDEFGLLHKTYLRAAGIVEEDEIELAKDIQKRTGLDWDKIVDDDYFKSKLDGLRTVKANALATSNVRGGQGSSTAKNSPEYWIAKGVRPTPDQVPDRGTRVKIYEAMIDKEKGGAGGGFYNE